MSVTEVLWLEQFKGDISRKPIFTTTSLGEIGVVCAYHMQEVKRYKNKIELKPQKVMIVDMTSRCEHSREECGGEY